MSFFKRKEKNLIPPVSAPVSARGPSPGPGQSSYRSNASTYIPSRDGDLSKSSSPAPPDAYGSSTGGSGGAYGSRYTRQNAVGDVYSRGEKNIDQDRGELFAGFNPEKAGSGRFFNDGPRGPPGRDEPAPGEENEEDVEGIKQQLRFTKQESVNSTRNALRLAREAEETARNTMTKLGSQSGMSLYRRECRDVSQSSHVPRESGQH
jgi:protein transport protein SEC9